MTQPLTTEQLLHKYRTFEQFTPIDLGSSADYEASHLPRAVNIPIDRIRQLAPSYLPDHGHAIVLYSHADAMPGSPSAHESRTALRAAETFRDLGYANVFFYPGGQGEWEAAGLTRERYVTQSPAQAYDPTYPMGT